MKDLVNKFLNNTISLEELTTLKKWIKNPKNKSFLKEALKTNQRLDLAYREIDVDKAYERIMASITTKSKESNDSFSFLLKYAAVAFIFICSTFALYFYGDTKLDVEKAVSIEPSQIILQLEDGSTTILNEKHITAITDKKGNVVVKQEKNRLKYASTGKDNKKLVFNRLTVPYGKRFEIELADGTVVFLNSGTTLRYPKDFTDPSSRDVFLNGEAFFTVKRNVEHPFVVHTQQMNVRVLGTKFNVSSYENEIAASTVLVEGSIEVEQSIESHGNDSRKIISPGQKATVANNEFGITDVNVQKHIAWINGTLYFADDLFQDILKELERYYNIKIINDYQELNHVKYTGTFRSKTIVQILEIFKMNTEFEYIKKNNSIIISSNPKE